MVLFVILEACCELGQFLNGSGIHIAMDNYFTSPLLFLCLKDHSIFAVGTCRRNKVGISGAFEYWSRRGEVLEKQGDMRFARTAAPEEEFMTVEWEDSSTVLILSTVHVHAKDFVPMEHR